MAEESAERYKDHWRVQYASGNLYEIDIGPYGWRKWKAGESREGSSRLPVTGRDKALLRPLMVIGPESF
jgi:hypothetical protein